MEITIPELPKFRRESPRIVLLFDRIRFELERVDANKHAEFYWYAREFPRYFRYHLDNIEFRLRKIHNLYEKQASKFLGEKEDKKNLFEAGISNPWSYQIYWEFEAFLNAIGAALDILARISGLEFETHTPVSLNNLVKSKDLTGVVEIFRAAKIDWIDNLKNLRDCFVHYVPIDSLPTITFYKDETDWKIWCKIPINPNVRIADAFEFSRDLDLLEYSISTHNKLMYLDKEVTNYLESLYIQGKFPKRIENLFNIGRRM